MKTIFNYNSEDLVRNDGVGVKEVIKLNKSHWFQVIFEDSTIELIGPFGTRPHEKKERIKLREGNFIDG